MWTAEVPTYVIDLQQDETTRWREVIARAHLKTDLLGRSICQFASTTLGCTTVGRSPNQKQGDDTLLLHKPNISCRGTKRMTPASNVWEIVAAV